MGAEREVPHDIQEERLALLSVLQELTVAALDLFDPRRPTTGFLERVAERLGCVAVLLLDETAPAPRLLGAVGLSASSSELPIVAGAPPALPFPELARPGLVTWRFSLDDERGGATTLLLCFEGEPQFAPQYRGMMRRLVSILHTALVHRDLYARLIESERERERRLQEEQRGRAAAEEAQRRAAFLAEASRRLSTSLNYEATLTRIARLPVPFVSDWCMVDVLEEEGMLRRAVVVHADPARSDVARRLERTMPASAATPAGVADVLRTGEPQLRERSASTGPIAPPEDEEIFERLGLERFIAVPLISRGATLGVLTIASGRDDLVYGPADVALAEEFGRRAALALDNARLYDSAQRAIRAREDLVAVVSHDLKNPLATIFMNVKILGRKLPPPETAPELHTPLDRIKRAGERMDRLIRDLLDLARIDAGHLVIEPAPEDAHALLAEALETVREPAAAKSIRLDLSAPELPPVRCDHERILQVLSNLLGNAVKFTPEGGDIELRAERRGDEVLFAVKDSGPGIPPEQLGSIFNRYWQAKETAHQGTGLGLSIAKALVELHGGHICVDSKPGAGSTFYFTLPIAGLRHG